MEDILKIIVKIFVDNVEYGSIDYNNLVHSVGDSANTVIGIFIESLLNVLHTPDDEPGQNG